MRGFSHFNLLPSSLSKPGTVLLRHIIHCNKNDPLTNEMELIKVNLHYTLVRHSDGKETTVSLRDLAPTGDVLAPNIVCKEGPRSQHPSNAVEGKPVSIAPWDSFKESLWASDREFISSQESQATRVSQIWTIAQLLRNKPIPKLIWNLCFQNHYSQHTVEDTFLPTQDRERKLISVCLQTRKPSLDPTSQYQTIENPQNAWTNGANSSCMVKTKWRRI